MARDEMDRAKSSIEAIEKVELAAPPPDALPLPDSLAHLEQDELSRLEGSLVRRLDCTLMPAIVLLFLLNIIDRNNIASAKLVGITETLNLTNNQYNTCLLLFYVGYVITQVPSNLIIGKVRPSIYICCITSAWGIVSMCQGFTKDFATLAVTRTILGLVEAPFLPGVFVLMSCWYKRTELPVRVAILYGGNMLATAFSGLIAAGITSRMEGKAGRPAWEWLFIIEGSMTVVIALLIMPLLPDYPLQSKHYWLSSDHQALAEYRIRKENAGIPDEDPESVLWGLKQALIDPKLYMFTIQQMALITAQSFNNFFPSIVGTLGYGDTVTLLLTAPPYFFAFIVSLCVSFHASHKHERGWHIAIPMIFALLGNLLAMFVPTTGGRYFSMFLMTAGSYAPYNLCVSWLSASLPRPRAKRGAALAVVNFMGAGVAHFYTSYMFPDAQKPRYYAGGAVMSGACVVTAAAALGIKWYLRRENERFEREEMGGEDDCWIVVNSKIWDVTDFLEKHPGGSGIILRYAGADATKAYDEIHAPGIIEETLPPETFKGTIKASSDTPPPATPADESVPEQGKPEHGKPELHKAICAEDFARIASEHFTAKTWAFYSSAATDLVSHGWNKSLLRRIMLRPRILRDVSDVDTTTTMLGHSASAPFFISPAAMARLAHPDGELALARAAGSEGIVQCVSNNASFPLASIVEAGVPGQPFFLQLYVNTNRDETAKLLRKAKSLGIKGIFVTVDAPVPGKREADERIAAENVSAAISGAVAGNDKKGGGMGRLMGAYIDKSLNWNDIAWIQEVSGLPVVLKGVQTADDARMALKYGIKGIMLSNHGGRSLDTAQASILILMELHRHCPEVFERMEVYLDGGFERGTDILKAIALGATAVGIGRPFLYSLAYGEEGAAHLIQILKDELETTMRLLGILSLNEAEPDLLNTADIDHLRRQPPFFLLVILSENIASTTPDLRTIMPKRTWSQMDGSTAVDGPASVYYLTKLRALRSDIETLPTTSPSEEPINDFISNGQLSIDDAERLFRLYYDRLDHFIYRVGGRYSTLECLRRGSPTLAACIYTVSSLHDPSSNHLYSVCKKEFRRLVTHSMFDGRVDRDYLRALAIGAYWLSDMSWMLSGIAVRRATEVNLSASFKQINNANNEEAVDLLRLWYISYISDSHLSILYGRAPMVRDDVAVQRADEFLNAPNTTEDDKRMMSQVTLLIIVRSIYDLFGPDSNEPIPSVYSTQISAFSRQLDHWLGRWSPALQRNASIGDFPAKGVLIHFHFAKLYLHSHVFRGLEAAAPPTLPPGLHDSAAAAVAAATSIIELLPTDADLRGGLNGMPAYLLSMTCFACVFLLKLTATTTAAGGPALVQRDLVARLAAGLVECFRASPVGRWHLVHLMADGLERLAGSLLGAGEAAVDGAAVLGGGGVGGGDAVVQGEALGLGRQFSTGLLGANVGMGSSPFFNFDVDFNYDGLSLL
ncbi:putative transporter [Neofusicoccum parvum]|uniref:Transporter n=1 Tax=Neofusicoccum parvum TaxID=310453 RepID=A0ACB5SM56_9PEZI|nr:putative transporter [Neofusicoccum parvum]